MKKHNIIIGKLLGAIVLTVYLLLGVVGQASAVLYPPTFSDIGANEVTINMQTYGTPPSLVYFTILPGTNASCGDGNQVKNGQNIATGATAIHGSLYVNYGNGGRTTVRNLTQDTNYTVCFTADYGVDPPPAPVSASFKTNAAPNLATSAWTQVGGQVSGCACHGVLAFSSKGKPFLAYRQESLNVNERLTNVRQYDGNSWVNVGSPVTSSQAKDISLTIFPDGTPMMAVTDKNTNNLIVKENTQQTESSQWTSAGGVVASAAAYPSLATTVSFQLWAAYQDIANGNKATVRQYNGSWDYIVGGYSATSAAAAYISLAIAPNGTPYLAYQNVSSSKAALLKYNGSTWDTINNAISDGAATDIALAIAPDNTVYVAYQDGNVLNKATVKKYNGSSWSFVGSAGFSEGEARALSLAFFPDGTPYVAYVDNNTKVIVKRLEGGAWATAGNIDLSVGSGKGAFTSLAIAPDGTPHLAFNDTENKPVVYKLVSHFKVTFDSKGGSAVAAREVPVDTPVSPPDPPVKAGYSFGGWYSDSAFNTLYNFSDKVTSDITLYAKWNILSYTVTYSGNGNTGGTAPVDPFSHEFNSQVYVKDNSGNLTRTGYTFGGWNKLPDGSGDNYPATGTAIMIMGSADQTLYAKWNVNRYYVTYDGNGNNGGSAPVDSTGHDYNSSVTVKTNSGNLTKTGTTFYGWNTARDRSGTGYSASGNGTFRMGAADLTLYAQWGYPLITPAISNLGANIVTLALESGTTGKGYFTLLSGNAACGTGTQVKNGQNGSGVAAFRSGSLKLTAGSAGYYTVRNLTENTYYTVCFTADDGTTLQQLPSRTNFTTTVKTDLSGNNWLPIGGAGFSDGTTGYESLAFAPDGTPYVAYMDGANGNRATVKKLAGSRWVPVGPLGFSQGGVTYIPMTFAPDGTPYVLYKDGAYGNKAIVKKFNSATSSWDNLGPSTGISTGIINDPALAFDKDGTLYIAYQDGDKGQKATVQKFDGANWQPVGPAGFSAGIEGYTSLAIAPDGTPYVAYQDYYYGGRATVMKFVSPNWQPVGPIGFSSGSIIFASLGFAPDGSIYLAYKDSNNGGQLMKFYGSNWMPVGDYYSTYWLGLGNYFSLAFDPDGAPYLTFQDGFNNSKATLKKLEGGSWVNAGSVGFSAGTVKYTSLAFSPDGTPFVAYQDVVNGNKSTVMRLVKTHMVNFNSMEGSAVAGQMVADNTTAVQPAAPVKTGYSFVAWYSDAECKSIFNFSTPITADITLYAKWSINSYRVSYSGNGNTGGAVPVDSKSYPYETTVIVMADTGNLLRTGYNLVGWNTAADGSGTTYATCGGEVFTMGGANVTLYAMWSAIPYMVTYDGNGSTSGTVPVDNTIYYFGNVVTVRGNTGNLSKTGYVLTGWNTAANGSGSPYAASGNAVFTMGAASVKLYAQWRLALITPTISNPGSNMVTLNLQSKTTGKGYFTLLPGSGASCGTGTQVKNGQNSSGAPAFRSGSLPLTANTAGHYTVRNLTGSTPYTVCFTTDIEATLQPPAAINLTTTVARSLTNAIWTVAGSTGLDGVAGYQSLAFAPDGTAYVAYMDGANSNRASVKKLVGSSWIPVGPLGFSQGAVTYIPMTFSPDGIPYVMYKDSIYGNKAIVKKFNTATSSWDNVGLSTGISEGIINDPSLAFDKDGTLYIAYQDGAYGQKATVKKFDGANWQPVGSAGFSAGVEGYTSLAIAPDGTPYVAYQDYAYGSRATVMKYYQSQWQPVGPVGFSYSTIIFASLAFAPDGGLYLADKDFYCSNKAMLSKFDGVSSWTAVGGLGCAGFSPGAANYESLAFAPNGAPYVAYQDTYNLNMASVKKYEGGTWANSGSADFSAGTANYTSLAFAPDGTPYVAYQDVANGNKTRVMKLQ